MQVELHQINVRLSNDQKQKIRNAFINSAIIRLRLTNDYNLRGPDTLIIPTSYFQERESEDGIYAVVDKQTKKEMQDEMRRELKFYRDDNLSYKMSEKRNDEAILGCFHRFFGSKENRGMEYFKDENLTDGKLSDETLEEIINEQLWEYYGLFFEPAIDKFMENKGIEFFLDYSLLNDLAKDFVKDNIKNLFH